MERLATNTGHKAQDNWQRLDYAYELFLVIMCFVFVVGMAVLFWRCLTYPNPVPGVGWMLLMLALVGILLLFAGLFRLDNYLRWRRAVETVWLHQDKLIIECRRCIFRRWKEIPLSSIQNVEPHRDAVGALYYQNDRPETLRMVYSGKRRYRFGLCMTDKERDDMAKKIMDLATREYGCDANDKK